MNYLDFVYVENLGDRQNPYELKHFFGKESKKMYYACKKAMHYWLEPYEGCYRSDCPNMIGLMRTLNVPEGSTPKEEAKKFIDKWYDEHPGERDKEETSKREWEAEKARNFRVIYGIAKRRGYYMEWLGNGSTPLGDQWIIYKRRKRVAILHIQ